VVDAAGFNNGQCERVFGLGGGETKRALDRRLIDRGVDGLELGGLDDVAKHNAKLVGVRQAEIHARELMFEFGWKPEAAT
jgi:hypothetical protein